MLAPADFLDCHFWDHGRRFTFVLLLTHVVLSRRPPVPGMAVIALNRNLPVHDSVVTSVRLRLYRQRPTGGAVGVDNRNLVCAPAVTLTTSTTIPDVGQSCKLPCIPASDGLGADALRLTPDTRFFC